MKVKAYAAKNEKGLLEPYEYELGEMGPDDVDIDSGCQKSRMPTTAPVLIHGQIDAVFKDESTKPPPGMSEWIIVDWKTVSVADCDRDALATHYQPQIQLYAYCWSIGLYSQ